LKYLLSVDGGGTKTEFCISDMQGKMLKSFFVGSSNYKSVGVDKVYKHFNQGLEKIKKAFSIGIEDITYSVWGISGCDSKNDYDIIKEQILRLGFQKQQMYLCNDGVLAFYAQAHEPGIVIISGTGSIIIGVDKNGNVRRCGGWGYNISDIGSGYWIGNEALKQTLLYCDGCCEYSSLYDKVREYFMAKNFEELPYMITEVVDYYQVAKVASLVAELSKENDTAAKEILKKGAHILARMTKQMYDKLEFNSSMKLNFVFSGGVLKNPEYETILKEELDKELPLINVKFSTQENPPAYGGIKLAQRILDRGDNNET
jgi:N-acetylglucosamine kinase-like BadF-type ATPase